MKRLDGLMVLALAAVLLLTGIDKIFHYDGFVNALRNYVALPQGWAPHIALPLILLEIVLGIGLLVRVWRRPAALGAGVLLLVFTAALWVDQRYGDNSVCGCWFTITLAKGTNHHIVFNLILAAMAFTLGLQRPTPEVVESMPTAEGQEA